MLVKKSWISKKYGGLSGMHLKITDEYVGWFLFGFIPLYINRRLRRYHE